MEGGSVMQFLENKTILVTGATGFLAKIMVEKVLRVQPNVKKLYLLLRAGDSKEAAQRFQNEVISKDLFRLVKEKCGVNLSTLISEKIHLVPGDISREDFLLKDPNLMQQMCSEVDLIANIAANTNFDERYDVSLGINTLGAKHVLNFAKKCPKLKAFVHVSTAYVCGEKGGLILESPYMVGETINGTVGLHIEDELRLVDEKLNELRADGADERTITLAMKDLGIERQVKHELINGGEEWARKYGWPNTYVFTKAMGEMILGQIKQNLPVVIVRPTIITSTFKEPFPGWVEGIRTIDSLAIGYGKGKLTCFLGDPKTVIDVIPADMVVNAILVSMAVHSQEEGDGIYHLGSSISNPMRFDDIKEYGYRYFKAKPWINKDGKPVKIGQITILNSMESFHRYMTLRYFLFLKGLEVANSAFCHYFEGTYLNLDRKIKYLMKMVELYRPYLFFKGVFDDMNTERLRIAARESGAEEDMFYLDPKNIDWGEYFINTHIPGAVRYVFK